VRKGVHSRDLVIFSDVELPILISDTGRSSWSDRFENTRENYFYVAEHPVPSEGGRRENLTILSPFLTLCSLQSWIACAVYLHFLCNLSSSFFCENTQVKDNGWKLTKLHHQKSPFDQTSPPALSCQEVI